MKFAVAFFAISSLAIIVGCGGGGGDNGGNLGTGEVSGIVQDENGYVVRGATVSLDARHQTETNSSGVYVLSNVPADFENVQAVVYQNGVRYVGENIANVVNGERTKDVNIAIFPDSQVATLRGIVTDRQGRLVTGVHVFARPNVANTILTSAVGVTDGNGEYAIGSLKSGLAYHIQVNALGYDSDQDNLTLSAGETRTDNFTLSAASGNNVPAPTHLAATAYTSPAPTRGDARQALAIEMMKRKLNPKRLSPSTRSNRLTSSGGQVEVDLFWDEISNTDLLGYGIYRGINAGRLNNTDFLRDPQAQLYADIDSTLTELTSYTYGITSVDTLFDGSQGESGMSNTASVRPLGDLVLGSVSSSTNPTFSWPAASGAASYVVYIYNQYPAIGVTEIYSNASSPTAGTSLQFTGTPLTGGQTYYVIVVGQTADGTAYTISPVNQFTVP